MYTTSQLLIILKLLIAHILGDFFLQSHAWVKDKEQRSYKSPYLYAHAGLHFLLTWLFLNSWNQWIVALVIAILHLCIDIWKLEADRRSQAKVRNFLLDQVAHVVVLILAWLYLIDRNLTYLWSNLLSDADSLIVMVTFLLGTFPVSILINMATRRWQDQLNLHSTGGLDRVGMWIGIVERIIIIVLIFANHYDAIGFLIAAKSLLRFSEEKQATPKSEYVLIGTLLSYGAAIALAAAAEVLIERF
ncbi:hypothetical protein BWI96_00260 [Siphonobacter sp. SORGH_AS_0500]|uniref:DUF3307 domain-containing protein n=1 Tax=Siphonobacter sp. SORGH_AS_0500 TaxID=1864824 RepID=UPI000CB9B9FB|nr:DUF3307 domain-containing protein [Siphonobacter sp. SORGH_AS_0500]PKK38264.1 hypothetical protein BWI96_00260 [Siphonobacter sp. SORGH_AS_0500]